MSFKLTIKTDNAAFDPNPALEVARILREIASDIDDISGRGKYRNSVRDVNGNTVGEWVFTIYK